MDKYLKMILAIEEESKISQRKLCKIVDCSLGTVNKMISELIEAKEVKINKIGINAYSYTLTKKGNKKKALLLHDFIIEGFDAISDIKKRIKEKTKKLTDEGVKTIYLLGDKDDIYKVIKMTLMEINRKVDFEFIHIEDDSDIDKSKKYFLFTWDNDNIIDSDSTLNVLLL